MDKIFKNIKYIELMPKVQTEKYPLIINMHGAGGQAKLTLLPGVLHNCWDYAYSQKESYDFLFANAKK